MTTDNPKPVLKPGIIYSADNGRLICVECAGMSAKFTGRDISGQRVAAVPYGETVAWFREFKTGRARVLGIGLKCAAAFSFENCENLIISSLEFSAGTFVQACGRIDRVVNKVRKNIYCILHKNSLEEVMFETVALKNDAANLCLRGQRIARDFKPVDSSEILATALDRFSLDGSTPESECEQKWVKLCARLQSALGPQSLN